PTTLSGVVLFGAAGQEGFESPVGKLLRRFRLEDRVFALPTVVQRSGADAGMKARLMRFRDFIAAQDDGKRLPFEILSPMESGQYLPSAYVAIWLFLNRECSREQADVAVDWKAVGAELSESRLDNTLRITAEQMRPRDNQSAMVQCYTKLR